MYRVKDGAADAMRGAFAKTSALIEAARDRAEIGSLESLHISLVSER